jgi:proteasome lid subunit RPN8/RPN11
MHIESLNETPVVYIDFLLLENIKQIVNNTDKEIMLRLSVNKTDNMYEITSYFMPKQKVSSFTCSIDAQEEMKQIFENNIDTDNLMGMFHSHVDMEAYPSGTDDNSFREQYSQVELFYLEMIMNKQGEYFLRLADIKEGLVYSKLELTVIRNTEGLLTNKEAQRLIKQNVIEEKFPNSRGVFSPLFDINARLTSEVLGYKNIKNEQYEDSSWK